ncbi:hypothetical protein Moror_11303 [Moniliophthora roreri MCA 2997]|uniref:Uncharacterized protein n=1 Tax=Moniliophthora roreri (strain MCA 2997) TaxID=1381753 RepID=V2W9R4_MONRO|nr:hypothetical protein Moror_11303 [Moniliophthora roreri MCA 2997]
MAKSGVDGVTLLIAEGILLDSICQKILHFSSQKNLSGSKIQQLEGACQKYVQQAASFNESILSFFPLIIPVVKDEKHARQGDRAIAETPKSAPLFLPSYFDKAQQATCQIELASHIEHDLREGQANDLLEEVQCHILTYNHITVVKKVEATSQRHHTRSQGLLNTQINGARSAMRLYNHTRKALIALGMDIHVIGESTPDSWYWNTSTQSGSSEREEVVWRLELNRVKWFCDHTCLDRYCEEIEILEAEFTHVCRFHKEMCDIWLKMAQAASDDQEPGYAAYACKQAATYQILLDDVVKHWSR